MKPLNGALQMSRLFLEPVSVAIDATCGNGHDTLQLARLAKKVYAFDIQPQAIQATKDKVSDFNHVQVIQNSYKNFRHYVMEPVDLVVFNLGYLPGSDKQIVTQVDDLEATLQALLEQLSVGGRVVIVAYPGHPEGLRESLWLQENLLTLDFSRFRSFYMQHLNGLNQPPELFLIERYAG